MRRRGRAAPGRSLEHRLAGVLCYLLGMVSAVVLLTAERESRFVRFHALQSILYTTLAVVVLGALLVGRQYAAGGVAALVALLAWGLLMYRAALSEWYQLPGLAWSAERSP